MNSERTGQFRSADAERDSATATHGEATDMDSERHCADICMCIGNDDVTLLFVYLFI